MSQPTPDTRTHPLLRSHLAPPERTLIDVHPDLPASRAVYAPRIDADFECVADGDWKASTSGLRYKFQRFERC